MTTAGTSATIEVSPERDNVLAMSDGLRIEIPKGALTGPGTLSVDAEATAGDEQIPAGSRAWRVDLARAKLAADAMLAFPAAAGSPDPLVGYLDKAGQVTSVASTRAGDHMTVRTRHFSTWIATFFEDLLALARQGLDRIYAPARENKQPRCKNEDDARAGGVKVASSKGSRALWCLDKTKDGLVLKVANGRGYAVSAEYTPGMSPIETPDLLAWLPDLADLLDRPSKRGNTLTLINSGETVEFRLATSPREQAIMLQPSVPAYLGTSLWYAFDTISMTAKWADVDPSKVLKAVDLATCGKQILGKRSVTIDNAGEAANYLNDMLGLAFGCFDDALEEAMAGSIISGLVVEGFAWVWSGILTAANGLGAAADTALDPQGYRIVVDLGEREPVVPTAQQLVAAGACDPGAGVTGSVIFTHPTWGRSVLASCMATSPPGPAGLAVFDATGTLRWSKRIVDGIWAFQVHRPGMDASGNLFVTYNPGRYDGVAIYRPTPGGLTTLAASAGERASGPSDLSFYYAELVGPGSDGLFLVRQHRNDCTPSCAQGGLTSVDYRWNGVTYTAS